MAVIGENGPLTEEAVQRIWGGLTCFELPNDDFMLTLSKDDQGQPEIFMHFEGGNKEWTVRDYPLKNVKTIQDLRQAMKLLGVPE